MEIQLRKTIAESTSSKSIAYIGADRETAESQECLEFHANLLVYHLGALEGLAGYHTSFPWRLVQCLDPKAWQPVLGEMADIWKFVVEVVDGLRSNHALFNELAVTRFQSFRECMITAEFLD